MSLKRGIVRATLAFGLPWVAFWGWSFWEAAQAEANWNRQANESVERQHGLTGNTLLHMNDMVRAARSLEHDARKRKELAIKVGAVAPAALALLLAACFWVWRGFRGGPNK